MLQRMKKSLNNKLGSNAGETLSETLVALLVSSLALVMLVGAIGAAVRIINNSKAKLDKYYAANEAMVNLSSNGPEGYSYGASGSVTITCTTAGTDLGVTPLVSVSYAKNTVFGNQKTVAAYKKKTATGGNS